MFFVLMSAQTGGMDAPTDDAKERNRKLDNALGELAKGSMPAWDVIYELTQSGIYAFAFSMLKSAEDAEDVMQDTYVKVCLNAKAYKSEGKPMAWIVTITRNLALMKLRSGKHEGSLPDYEWNAVSDEAAENFGTEDRIVIKSAMKVLNDEEAQIVMLHAVSGLKHREIAEIYNMPLATVLSKYNRSIKKLQKALEDKLEQQ